MEYRKLGNSGLDISTVGIGTNNFGRRMDLNATQKIIHKAIDLGINFFDTSNTYGNQLSEEYIGKTITKDIRKNILIATKFGMDMGGVPNNIGASRKHILEQVDDSLKRLNTDYVDLYQIHVPDPNTPILETLTTLNDLVRSGKVRYIGCSNFAGWQIAQAMETSRKESLEAFVSNQPEYSMLNRSIETEILPACENYKLGILPFFPLANGFLTGKYKRNQPPPSGTRLSESAESANAYFTSKNFDIIEKLEQLANEANHTVTELAISWLLSNNNVSSVISGATKTSQLEINAKAADWTLESDILDEIEIILNSKGSKSNNE
ncbi:MAG: aldo/keto reductase [Chloroflexi bacterium]|nr:aldo/keto reductase [Chloroflexota bacterium]|tara:strand:- start:25918 stop:26883 length:966 start_codon:yes stop_codon:yes gene_type:complete